MLMERRSDLCDFQLTMLLSIVRQVEAVSGAIAEVGSWRCGTSIEMAKITKKPIYCFDLFGGMPYPHTHDFENFADVDFAEIQQAVAPYNIGLVRGLHEETIPKFFPVPLSMIFMDSDWYSSHVVALNCLVPELAVGGYIVFHDWTFGGVQKAVEEVLDLGDFEEPQELVYQLGRQHMKCLKRVR